MLANVTTKQETGQDHHQNLIGQLRQQINKTETSLRNQYGTPVSCGSPAIDQWLPSGGIPRGTLTEWFVDQPGHSGEFLSLQVASQALSGGGALVIADPGRRFYPPAAALLGIEQAKLVVLRPERPVLPHHSGPTGFPCDDLFWAVDQALRSTAVAAVWGCFTDIHERWFRRFQLSAESSGCLGLFVRPARTRQQPSWAETQWQIRAKPGPDDLPRRQVSLKLLRCRAGKSGKTISLNTDIVTGSVQRARTEHDYQDRGQARALSLATQLAHPAIGRRSARA